MNLEQVSAKINTRLNKGDSADYDNIWRYQKEEAFNKAVNDWVRRQIRGKNQTQEGDEETTARVDDLQVLLKTDTSLVRDKGKYSEAKLPLDYLYFKRVTPIVSKGSCKNVSIQSYLKEEANIDTLNDLPSFEFEETHHTLIGNKVNVYHYKRFDIDKIEMTYYRKPKVYNFDKLNTVVEFKDDVAEILVDEACKIIASDIESQNQKILAQERAENNN